MFIRYPEYFARAELSFLKISGNFIFKTSRQVKLVTSHFFFGHFLNFVISNFRHLLGRADAIVMYFGDI